MIGVDSVTFEKKNPTSLFERKQTGRGDTEKELMFVGKLSVIGSCAGVRAAWSSWGRPAFCTSLR